MEKVKNGAAILGAVASAFVGIYGVYEKVRTDARADTAASYNTLAPQLNQMGEALRQLQQENQQLREIVAHGQGKPRMAVTPPASNARRREPRAPAAASSAAPANAPAAVAQPATNAGPNAGAPAASATPSQEPAAGAAPVPAPPAAAEAPTPTANEEDRISGLLRTVGRTREAIDNLRKVPEDFGRVVGKPQ